MIDTDKLMKSIYEEAEKELIKFGVRKLLTQMGFKVDEFNTKINLTVDNYLRANEIINKEELKKIDTKLRRKIAYHIDNLEEEVVANAVSALQKKIIEQTELQLSMNIKTKLFKSYYDKMKQELTNKVMEDSTIRTMILKEL